MSLATTARPYGPPWHRMGSVTAPEGGNLVLCIAGLLGGHSPSLHPEWVPAGSCSGKDNPMGQNPCRCLCCFYCFIISQVKKRKGYSFGCNLLTYQLSGFQPWLNPANYTVLAFLNHILLHTPRAHKLQIPFSSLSPVSPIALLYCNEMEC